MKTYPYTGADIRRIRLATKRSQAEMADLLDTTQPAVSRWEANPARVISDRWRCRVLAGIDDTATPATTGSA